MLVLNDFNGSNFLKAGVIFLCFSFHISLGEYFSQDLKKRGDSFYIAVWIAACMSHDFSPLLLSLLLLTIIWHIKRKYPTVHVQDASCIGDLRKQFKLAMALPSRLLKDQQIDFHHANQAKNNALSSHLFMMSLYESLLAGAMLGIWRSGNCPVPGTRSKPWCYIPDYSNRHQVADLILPSTVICPVPNGCFVWGYNMLYGPLRN